MSDATEIRSHIAEWINNNVVGSITPEQALARTCLWMAESVEAANSLPVERRISLAAMLLGMRSGTIADARFSWTKDTPYIVEVHVMLERPIEQVQIHMRIGGTPA